MKVYEGLIVAKLLSCAVLVCLLLVTMVESACAQARVAIPSVERQKEIGKDLERAYNLAKVESASKKQDAIRKLMEAVGDANLATDEKYVVLMTVITLAKEAGEGSWRCPKLVVRRRSAN